MNPEQLPAKHTPSAGDGNLMGPNGKPDAERVVALADAGSMSIPSPVRQATTAEAAQMLQIMNFFIVNSPRNGRQVTRTMSVPNQCTKRKGVTRKRENGSTTGHLRATTFTDSRAGRTLRWFQRHLLNFPQSMGWRHANCHCCGKNGQQISDDQN